jgi:precorrin-3B C17-methyltransferase
MSGWLRVVGLGPAGAEWVTPEVTDALATAEHLLGYHTYLRRVSPPAGATLHGSDNGDELARARHALELALGGARVVVVSGGDAGVFGMAAAVFEAIEHGPPSFAELDVRVLPAVTAMLAAAARLGAPLGHDFCALNLSDNLKPWATIERRLALAAQADFVLALYNPASRARSEQVQLAFALLRQHRAPSAIVDMRTLILVGSSSTRRIERPGAPPWIYTPRGTRQA